MVNGTERRIRYRATSIVMRDGKVLLMREPQDTEFHLPGGGIEPGELPISAAARELYEESGLVASSLKYLFDYCDFWAGEIEYWGQVHPVFRAKADGDVVLSAEHCESTWWDMDTELPLIECVMPMLCMLSRSE